MKRREFFERAGLGSAALVTLPGFSPGSAVKRSGAARSHEHDGKHEEMDGPLATADVSFGQWDLDTPLDRFPNNSPRDRNYHHLTPDVAEIKAGGAVNFHIAGFHHILIYDDGTKPEDINIAATIPTDGAAGAAAHQRSGQAHLPGARPERAADAAGQHAAAAAPGPHRDGALPEPGQVPGDLRRPAAFLRRGDRPVHHVRVRQSAPQLGSVRVRGLVLGPSDVESLDGPGTSNQGPGTVAAVRSSRARALRAPSGAPSSVSRACSNRRVVGVRAAPRSARRSRSRRSTNGLGICVRSQLFSVQWRSASR